MISTKTKTLKKNKKQKPKEAPNRNKKTKIFNWESSHQKADEKE